MSCFHVNHRRSTATRRRNGRSSEELLETASVGGIDRGPPADQINLEWKRSGTPLKSLLTCEGECFNDLPTGGGGGEGNSGAVNGVNEIAQLIELSSAHPGR